MAPGTVKAAQIAETRCGDHAQLQQKKTKNAPERINEEGLHFDHAFLACGPADRQTAEQEEDALARQHMADGVLYPTGAPHHTPSAKLRITGDKRLCVKRASESMGVLWSEDSSGCGRGRTDPSGGASGAGGLIKPPIAIHHCCPAKEGLKRLTPRFFPRVKCSGVRESISMEHALTG